MPARPTDRASAGDSLRDGPAIPPDVSGHDLSRDVRQQLRALPDKVADVVARHLVMTGRLLDTDPDTAYQHAHAARSRAARLAVVREASAEAAYATGRYAEALAEFRAVRRMTGSVDYLPVIADCERALGRPERALLAAAEPAARQLDTAGRVEMAIVAAGARLDLGQPAAAVHDLARVARELPDRGRSASRLRYAYARALLAAGQDAAAAKEFARAAAADPDAEADRSGTVPGLDGVTVTDTSIEPDA